MRGSAMASPSTTKAGIVLGFAGALVALGLRTPSPVGRVGLAFAVLAAASALLAFWPQRYPALELSDLRASYLDEELASATLRLLATRITMSEELARTLRAKSWRLQAAMSSMFVAVLFLVVGEVFVAYG